MEFKKEHMSEEAKEFYNRMVELFAEYEGKVDLPERAFYCLSIATWAIMHSAPSIKAAEELVNMGCTAGFKIYHQDMQDALEE